jgi:hypothetical protein
MQKGVVGVGSGESPSHVALRSATAKGWLGWPTTQITMVRPFHVRVRDRCHAAVSGTPSR